MIFLGLLVDLPTGEPIKFTRLGGGLWNKKYMINAQIMMLIYQSKANLDGKFLFGKISHHLDPDIW